MAKNSTYIGSIAKAIGKGHSSMKIITSIVLAFIILFYIFTLGSFLKVTVYVLQDRISVYRLFYQYLLGKYVDNLVVVIGTVLWLTFSLRRKIRSFLVGIYSSLIVIAIISGSQVILDFTALVSLPLILSVLLVNKFGSKIKVKDNVNSLIINYLSIIGIAIGGLSLFISSLIALALPLGAFRYSNYAYNLSILLSSVSPILLILLVFSFPLKLLTKRLIEKTSGFEIRLTPYNARTRTKVLWLSLIISFSIMLGLVPHQPSLNTDSHPIGADTTNYILFINILEKSGNTGELIKKAFVEINGGDRPLTLLFLLLTVKASPFDHAFTIDRLPLIFSPIMILVVFFLTRELTSNDVASFLASFLTVVSFHTLVGTYAGFYANWIALVVGYLSIIFLFRYLKKPNKLTLIIYSGLIIVTLFCHVYTWTILTIVTVIFLGIISKLNYYGRKSAFLLFLVIFASVAIDVARMTLTGSTAGVEQDLSVAQQQRVGVEQFNQRWYNLINTTHFHYGALFGNFFVFALGLYWLFKCSIREPYNIFLLVFVSLGIIPLFLGDWVVQSRVFYDIPFQIPAAIALTILVNTRNGGGTLMVIAICIWLMAFSIRSVSNF